jgi:hypothetical protein
MRPAYVGFQDLPLIPRPLFNVLNHEELPAPKHGKSAQTLQDLSRQAVPGRQSLPVEASGLFRHNFIEELLPGLLHEEFRIARKEIDWSRRGLLYMVKEFVQQHD